ncbi:hypothetical protein C8Q77DRAFT_550942 [Trametes polyzona]|nr:hypothetical protein C8Q77DRAFT_550942 [Trametes polyzona]
MLVLQLEHHASRRARDPILAPHVHRNASHPHGAVIDASTFSRPPVIRSLLPLHLCQRPLFAPARAVIPPAYSQRSTHPVLFPVPRGARRGVQGRRARTDCTPFAARCNILYHYVSAHVHPPLPPSPSVYRTRLTLLALCPCPCLSACPSRLLRVPIVYRLCILSALPARAPPAHASPLLGARMGSTLQPCSPHIQARVHSSSSIACGRGLLIRICVGGSPPPPPRIRRNVI